MRYNILLIQIDTSAPSHPIRMVDESISSIAVKTNPAPTIFIHIFHGDGIAINFVT